MIIRDDLTESQVRAFRIADNKLAESEWSLEQLMVEMESLNINDYDLDYTGFDTKELNEMNFNEDYKIEDKKDKIIKLENLYKPDFLEIKKILKGKKVFVSGGPGRLIGLLHTLSDYEVEIQSAALFWPHPWSQNDLRHMKEKHGINIKNIIVSPGLDDLQEVANNYEIDLWLGGYQEQHVAKKYNIPFVPITVYTSPHVGFEGVVNLGNKLKLALEGYDFTENILKAKEIQPCIYRLNETE